MTTPRIDLPQPQHDAGLRAFMEWCDYEGIGAAEWKILGHLAEFGLSRVSNTLYWLGWSQGLGVLKVFLQAAFQLGRAVERRERIQK